MCELEVDLLLSLVGDIEIQFGIDPKRDQDHIERLAERGFPCLVKELKLIEDAAVSLMTGKSGLISSLFRELATVSLPSVRVVAGFLTKLDINLGANPTVMSEMSSVSVQNEARLRSIRSRAATLRYLRDFSRSYLSENSAPTIDDLVPRHSNGAVLEGLSGVDKFDCQFGLSIHEVDSSFFGSHSISSPAPSYARFFCVPKDALKLRAISIEPSARQYIQQGARRILHKYIRSGSIGAFIHDDDQSINGDAASLENCATIDMSNASDSVRMSHVYCLFSNWRWFRRLLFSCRSSQLRMPNGDYLHLTRYAGMGNATTFLVESLCFLAIARGSILDVAHSTNDGRLRQRAFACAAGLRVYGDDIVVPDNAFAGCVVMALSDAGYIVNNRKTCITGYFKESCGAEWFHGQDVRVPRLHQRITRYRNGNGLSLTVLVQRLRRWHANQTLTKLYRLLNSDPYSQYALFGKHDRDLHLVYQRDIQSCCFRGITNRVRRHNITGSDGLLLYFTSGTGVISTPTKECVNRLLPYDVLIR